MSWVLAVDFGTSNTAAAHRIGPDRVETLPLTHTGNALSSSVFVGQNAMSTGDVALNQASLDPAGFVVAPKSLVVAGSIVVRDREVPVSSIIAAVLRTVYGQALQRHNNEPPAEVVLTHPEAWSSRELSVLREAASIAGLGGSVSLISEPRAAAFYYSRQHDAKIVKGSTIAVFDFGGGTLDVAVLTATNEWTFEVLRAGGDNALGGKSLDGAIARWVEQHLAEENPQLAAWLRTPDGLETRRTLDDQIRKAKELLSEAPSATIRVRGNGSDMTLTLTRDEFEQLIEPQITRAVHLARGVLRDAGIGGGGLQALYLTGGSSRIPYVHRRLAELGPIATLDDPKTVVAKGAAGFVAGGRVTDPPALVDTEVLERRPTPNTASTRPPAAPLARPNTDSSTPTRNNRKIIALAGGALAAAVIAAAGFYYGTQDDAQAAEAAATTTEAAAAPDNGGKPPATSDSSYVSESYDDVTALLPRKLVDSSSECNQSGFSTQGALQVRCLINPNSSLGRSMGMEQNDYAAVTAWRDDQYARSTFIRTRDTDNGNTVVESTDGTRIVDQGNDGTYFTAIDRSTGLLMQFSSESSEQGMTLLTEIDFIQS
ncbi:Hsp70 family protein [Rhodococcus artemisiae]|uniref:Hsp70 family protein n=1 Tax=Rhodococcus artemisiae TaxID=714159 RepID=A0ABU7LJB3_9NOCA|nr:Hsp70 family protein [Rhodococcus artemisiae]MEE2061342.1 Hsp70 family protein [Rhodococcus artemisiae]